MLWSGVPRYAALLLATILGHLLLRFDTLTAE